MRAGFQDQRASGLIVVLAVLAMLSIMAVTFVTLSRIESRITTNYVDDQRAELLVQGAIRYVGGVLRDDLDRTWRKYENRDMGVGIAATYGASEGTAIPGLEGASWGTGPCNDVWYSSPQAENWGDWGSLYDVLSSYSITFQSAFVYNDYYNRQHGIMGRYERNVGGKWVEADTMIDRIRNCWGADQFGRPMVVDKNSQHYGPLTPIDDDGDGDPNSLAFNGDWYGSPYGLEENADVWYYWDRAQNVMNTYNQFMFPGQPLTGEFGLPNGLVWRWSLNVGYNHSLYMNINVAGNVELGSSDLATNMGNIGLRTNVAAEDQLLDGDVPRLHRGRIEWRGFSGEYADNQTSGFPANFNAVAFQPSQMNLERLFYRPGLSSATSLTISRAKAQALVRARWPNGKPADGNQKWRPGWRRDGATYYKLPSPENPQGQDHYFGTNEVLEHDRASYHGGSSVMPLSQALGGVGLTPLEQAKLRSYLTCWSTDTILRGKIWPTEGPPYTSSAGDWRHIDILKRVNINLIGASGPEGLPGEDVALKNQWLAKRDHERERLYYMLRSGMAFSGTGSQQMACQFIASLADMVDRDHDETYYAAPDGSGAWALGVEKFPVINEVEFNSASGADTDNYALTRLRVELYSPAENIPWIPDADEAYNISDYVLQVGPPTVGHYFRLGDLNNYKAWSLFSSTEKATTIGASGIYGMGVGNWSTSQGQTNARTRTWDRFVVVGGWPGEFPASLSRLELEGRSSSTDPNFAGVTIALWKPVSIPATVADTTYLKTGLPGFSGRRYMMVDTMDSSTGKVRLIQPYDGTAAKPGPGWCPNRVTTSFTGCYRRWDPLNGKVYVYQNASSNYGTTNSCNVYYAPSWGVPIGTPQTLFGTLGRPNIGFQANAYVTLAPWASAVWNSQWERRFERNFKVVDGDLPSIGWLGELMLYNTAINGPVAQLQTTAQSPAPDCDQASPMGSKSNFDTFVKFDLFKPFGNEKNLHMLDIFTVWDPSNDGIDNDGDGAVDDADTGRQAGDKGGPEIRVFGRVDLNLMSKNVFAAILPDTPTGMPPNYWATGGANWGNFLEPNYGMWSNVHGRNHDRGSEGGTGPFETIGDLLRVSNHSWGAMGGYFCLLLGNHPSGQSVNTPGDDDGDGIADELDERDMPFTWIANYFTTRANVFELNMTADVASPPYYPGRLLPMKAWRSRTIYARRQILGVIDRSTTLRVLPNGRCDFTGPVELKVLRFSDDARVW